MSFIEESVLIHPNETFKIFIARPEANTIRSCLPPVVAAPTLEAVDGKRLRVRWTKPQCEPPVMCYIVHVHCSDTSQWTVFDAVSNCLADGFGMPVQASSTSSESCVIEGLSLDVTYKAAISSKNAAGWSAVSDESKPLINQSHGREMGFQSMREISLMRAVKSKNRKISTQSVSLDVPPVIEAPFLEVVDDTRLRVRWTKPLCDPPVLCYTVHVHCASATEEWTVFDAKTKCLSKDFGMAVRASSTRLESCEIEGLFRHATYKAAISSKNAAGWSTRSSESKSVCILFHVPPVVEAPSLEVVDDTSLRVLWTKPQCKPPVLCYTVHVHRSDSSKWTVFDPNTKRLASDFGMPVQGI